MSTTMESPLTQQSRPETFKPKVSQDYAEPSEGFWREFFLLPPDRAQLIGILEALSPDETLNLQSQTQQLFARAIREAASGSNPVDSYALDKYTNPSSDVITVLAGLDKVDQVISNFVAVLDGIIRSGSSNDIRFKAIRTAIALTSGAYKTGLVSYFTHRDLFPSIMKLVNESESPMQVFEPFLLLGLLANYNKFEFQNPYQLRLDDFVNETSIQKIVKGFGISCGALRNGYVAVQDDLPEGWTLMGTLIYFGLGVLAPSRKEKPTPPSLEEAKEMFAALPAQQAAILLATYDFTNANKLFGYHLINTAADKDTEESPFSSFLSLTSYLLHHAYRSPRVSHYAELSLFTLRILSEDSTSCKLLCSDESKRKVRLCRQRQPYLPVVAGDRVLATAIFDILIDAISHNLRRRLDVQLYSHTMAIVLRLLTYLSMNRIRLHYHWSELWRNLLSLMRFLTTYASDLATSPHINTLATSLVDLVAFCVSAGDTFLPDPSSYDDLFYKLVETGPIIAKFRDVYSLKSFSSSSALSKPTSDSNKDIHVAAVETLISVSTHFYVLLFNPGTAGADAEKATADGDTPTPIPAAQKKNMGPREVHRIIKQGYDTLSIQPPEGLSAWMRYRETDWKPELKRAARVAVEDATQLVA
ncbi:ARMH3 family protein [Aspergillus undulatus]|uniref:ARMH3 family protein n=1 Tax=Aspergillus undulatus TaxID=1810928 RepID=UPI003CCCB8F6